MQYIKRELERKFLHLNGVFKAILVTGARQVGKSTMLRHLAAGDSRTCITMDDARLRELARSDPRLFFQMYPPPILIDEVQKAPELFEQIKILCDASEECGLFWLTGAQSKKLMQESRESLAGRLCILKMYSLSQRESAEILPEGEFGFSLPELVERQRRFPPNDVVRVFEHIWRGGMPDVRGLDEEQLRAYFNSYVETYLMRDATEDNGITDTAGFRKFLRACAAFCGQLVNYSDLAVAAGISAVTAKAWCGILQNMGIIELLEPYASNELKRLTKTPKLYFCDTGLCAFLSAWTSRDTLMHGAASGHYYENYVVGEFLRNYAYGRVAANLNFYRDSARREIDLVIEQDGVLYPIEIKKGTAPDKSAIRAFDVLRNSVKPVGSGGIVCMAEQPFPIDAQNCLIPSNIL